MEKPAFVEKKCLADSRFSGSYDGESESSVEFLPPRQDYAEQVSRKRRRTYFSVIIGLIALAIFASVIIYFAVRSRGSGQADPPIWVTKYQRQKLQPMNLAEADVAFTCLPNGNGLLYLTDEVIKSKRLPAGLPSGDGGNRLYGMAWAHELYCLATLRTELKGLMENSSRLNLPIQMQNEEHRGRTNQIHQCFDYLRQKILCAADTTLEYPTGDDPEVIDGYGIEQECGDWNPMGLWYERNHPVALHNFTGFGRYLKFPHWAEETKKDGALA
ncbi:hypothetical protein DCS_04947 [Drechmeria coniospora]|uniref:Tat pathway signal sequence n=1 Tax=Drechmeria coniospora TaxID=98403 RepID=A0A151GLE9_DRECN|nr:hypothetical protein DCS_04947 [Drechmeria coniospora]KYK57934.1 hypothetical protein DCS_04947 [Drechmeria coniospora]